MNFANELLFAGVIPLAIAVLATFFFNRLQLATPASCGAGIALGYIGGQFALASRAGIDRGLRSITQPREAVEWLPYAVLLALGVTMLVSAAPRAWRPAIVGLAALLALAVPARLLAAPVAQQWPFPQRLLYLALIGATIGLVWWVLAAARDERHTRLRQALVVCVFIGAALIMTHSGSFSLGRLCGVVAAAVAGTAIAAPRGFHGAAGVVAILLGGLLILGTCYAHLQPASAALVILSLIAAAGPSPGFTANWPPAAAAAARIVLCLTPLGIAAIASWSG